VVENVHGGRGKIVLARLFDGNLKSGIYFYEATMEPGAIVGNHLHFGSEEVLYVVEGKVLVTIDDNSYYLEEGDATLTPSGSSHSWKNVGGMPLKVLVVSGTTSIAQRLWNLLLFPVLDRLQDRGSNPPKNDKATSITSSSGKDNI